jgi:two-component system, cell cycle response regulator
MTPAIRALPNLADRIGFVQVVRVVAGALVMPSLGQAAVIAVAYVAVTTAIELRRRQRRVRGLEIVSWLLLLDGVGLAGVLAVTGGPTSPYMFLLHLHVVAATLLLSWRTGVKIAVWHLLLLATAQATWAAGTEPGILQALGLLAVTAATASFAALRDREIRRAHDAMRALAGMDARMQSTSDRASVEAALAEAVCTGLGVVHAAVVPARDGVAAGAVFEMRTMLVRELDGEAARALPGACNVAIVPIAADGAVHGALLAELGGRPGARVSGGTLQLLGEFAAHAALALRNADLHNEIKRLATTDGLTGLSNRRVFEATITREVARAARSGEPLSLVMVDVDHFKRINDALGHQVGDEVLRHLGKVLRTSCREMDLAARYGGEEFVLLLPGCDAEMAALIAEQVRVNVVCGAPVACTVSAGVAVMPHHALSVRDLVASADAALYRAKRGGRDRVVVQPLGRPRTSDKMRSASRTECEPAWAASPASRAAVTP